MKYCQFCGKMLEDGAQCTCEEAQAAAQAAQQPPQPVPPQASQQPQQVPPQAPPQQQVPPQQVPPQYTQQPPLYTQAPPQYAQAPQQPPRQPSEMQQKAKAAANGLLSFLKTYFASPAQAVQSHMTQDGMMVSILLTVIRVLALGLAIFGVLHKICSSAASAVNSYSYYNTVKISAPFFGSLLYGILIAAIGMGLFILVVFVCAKAQKSTLSLGGAWQASANNGVLATALLLLAFLLSFVSISMALAFIAMAILASLIFGALTVQYTCPGSDSGLCWLVYFIGAVVVIFIGYQLFPMLLVKAAGGIKLSAGGESMTLGTMLDQAAKSFKEAFSGHTFDEIIDEIFSSALRYGF